MTGEMIQFDKHVSNGFVKNHQLVLIDLEFEVAKNLVKVWTKIFIRRKSSTQVKS